MISFFVCLVVLIVGFFTYGKIAEKVFGSDDRTPPSLAMTDGADYVPMSTPRVFLIQLLNIAGLGPIFGALAGACWGPSVFLWITLGTIFAGAVHDFMIGMMAMRHKGASVSELTGTYLGKGMLQVMRVCSVVLLVLVGVTFSTGPANLLAMLTPKVLDTKFWLVVVLIYYFIATFVPIDKVIGKIYPVFGICLIVMALGVGGGILLKGYHIPEITLTNLHPSNTPIWPIMFVSVACGAISGFHATQSPLMARCIRTENTSGVSSTFSVNKSRTMIKTKMAAIIAIRYTVLLFICHCAAATVGIESDGILGRVHNGERPFSFSASTVK